MPITCTTTRKDFSRTVRWHIEPAMPDVCGASLPPGGLWVKWLEGVVTQLVDNDLLRLQRPTLPTLSSTKALIHSQDLEAWANGLPPAASHLTSWSTWSDMAAVDDPRQGGVMEKRGLSDGRQTAVSAVQAVPRSMAWASVGSMQLNASLAPLARPDLASGAAQEQPQALRQQLHASATSNQASQHHRPPLSQPSHSGPTVTPESHQELRDLTLFSLNDYMGLASHPDVCQAAASAALKWGLGARSSAVVAGTSSLHRALEQELAQLKGTQDCLLFPTGFAANVAVITALASSGPVAIFSDQLNHASIVDGARLACRATGGASSGPGGATLHVYRHNDMQHLEQLLQACPAGTRCMVVTDSLFSMDGNFADLQALAVLRSRYGFLLVVDEAHASLVCGDRGGGAAEAFGVADQVDVHVGTLSKAAGALGGFAACSRLIKHVLVNKGRPYIYSTALPLPVVAAARAALATSAREAWRRSHLWALVSHLGQALGVPALSPVVPLVVGSEQAALKLASSLLRAGLHVPAIRPPTVAPGTCRLRVSLCAAHSFADVDRLVTAVRQSGVVLTALPALVEQAGQAHMQAVWPQSLRGSRLALQSTVCPKPGDERPSAQHSVAEASMSRRLGVDVLPSKL
ncbi:pyridoxal phosphate-dependent transferase [Haematococcus lacustris]